VSQFGWATVLAWRESLIPLFREKKRHHLVTTKWCPFFSRCMALHPIRSPGWRRGMTMKQETRQANEKEFIMRPTSWHPPVAFSSCEQTIITHIKRAKLFVFLPASPP
jgi:hypothetical protein